jgi:nitrogen fixation NifU-like protein
MNEKLYQEELLEHFKHPHNKKTIQNSSFAAGKDNPSCGDRIFIEGIIQQDVVTEIGFSGNGCVISQAATSMLTDYCTGKTVDEILALTKKDMLSLVGIQLGPNRLKCALLGLQVLQDGIVIYCKNKTSN